MAQDRTDDALEIDWEMMADLRTDHAGETGAVAIYRGVLAVSRDPEVVAFAREHMATERSHLALMERLVPPSRRSRFLPLWRLAGFMTGALPALFGPRAVFITVEAVERFVDRHLSEQIEALEARDPAHPLIASLRACRDDELRHLEEAAARHGGAVPLAGRMWGALIEAGSRVAVALARRI
ncbi:MAG: demethoxyubiquinone hydroxylase family protein [Alphaproteobacteria bacterium]